MFIVGSEAVSPNGPSGGIISRYDGSQWLPYQWTMITSVWASSATNAIVVGQGGRILHYDGTPITARFIARAIGEHLDALKVTPLRKVMS